MKQIAVLGCGTVGSGVVEVFYKNRDSIERKAGCPLDIKWIYLRRPHPELPWQDKLCFDFDQIVSDPQVQIVVEVMGGLDPAYRFVKSCLQSGKSVATANKELIAQKGAELLQLARENGVKLLFEASVGGGIPIIRPLHQCLGANEIDNIEGILNGTTNFILTKMRREHSSFSEALEQAQALGYAESDPTADIDGIDACRKICILASLAYGRQTYPEAVHCEGIGKLTPEDTEYAEDWGGVIKLIAKASRSQDGQTVSMLVAPMFVPQDSQLAGIDDVFNGILVDGDATGEVLFTRDTMLRKDDAAVLEEHGIHIDHVVQHNHWNGKDCPKTIRATPGAWEAFLALCRGESTGVSELDAAVDKLAAAGLIDSPDYWKGGDYSAENVQALIIKWAASR